MRSGRARWGLLLGVVAVAAVVVGSLARFARVLRGEPGSDAEQQIDVLEGARAVAHVPQRAANQLFVVTDAYLVDGDARARERGGPWNGTHDVLLIVVGIGDFTTEPHPKRGGDLAPPFAPNMTCRYEEEDEESDGSGVLFDPRAYLHTKGTAYDGQRGKSGTVRYTAERAVLISCHVPVHLAARAAGTLQTPPHGSKSSTRFRISGGAFDTGWLRPTWYLSYSFPRVPSNKTTLCSSAIHYVSGTQFLMEWIEYHRALGFDFVDLYVEEIGPQAKRVVDHYARRHADWMTVHNWTQLIDGGNLGLHAKLGVGRNVTGSEGFERAQRMTRTDCYYRNRGRSRWVAFIDLDEFIFLPGGDADFRRDLIPFCDRSGKLGCSLRSTTFFPILAPPHPQQLLTLERLSPTAESECRYMFNCGVYHYGRRKYLLKTAYGSPNPGCVIHYHALSDDLEFSDPYHVLVPKSMAYLRHYSPSKYGPQGRYDKNGTDIPFPDHILRQMKAVISGDAELRALHEEGAGMNETFLKFYDGMNWFRFNL